MTAATIDLLGELLKDNDAPSISKAASLSVSVQYKAIDNFVDKYTNLAYGWYIAGEYARRRQPFPLAMLGDDAWVYRAYLFRLNPRKYYDKVVAEAKALSVGALEEIGRTLRAFLIVDGATVDDVAERTSIDKKVVAAFAALFYNVIDRRQDSAYIARAVYPATRFVTLRQGYFDHADVGDLLLRAGFETGESDSVAYMAGMEGGKHMKRLVARGEAASQLEDTIMANAVNIASIGLVNQQLTGLQQSRALMVADKQGGVQATPAPVLQVADSVKRSLDLIDIVHNNNRRAILGAMESPTIDV